MDAQHWLEQVRAELARQKLPPQYVERLTSELSDHITDFMEDHMSTEAFDRFDAVRPMGSPRQVAVSAANEHRNATFCGRHPLLTLVAMPIVVLPLLWVAFLLVAIMVLNMAKWSLGIDDAPLHGPLPAWQDLGLRILFQCVVQIPIIGSAVLFCHLAKRAALPLKWTFITCGLLAFVGSLACAELALPTAQDQGRIFFGLGLSQHPKPMQIGQFTLPLVIGALALWRDTLLRRRQAMA